MALSSHGFSQRVDRRRPAAIFRRLREASLGRPRAPVAELVDALDSKSSSARSAGSIPARGTILLRAAALRRIAAAKIAKQDALRSLSETRAKTDGATKPVNFLIQLSNNQPDAPPHSRGSSCPSCAGRVSLNNREGTGKAGCLGAPAASRAKNKKHTSKSPQVHRNNPAFPARLVLTASFVLSLVIGLSCHHPP